MNSSIEVPHSFTRTYLALGTLLRVQVVSTTSENTLQEATNRALAVVKEVEEACSRFDQDSELVKLVQTPVGKPVSVSSILFQCLQFACEVARWTKGRFDPAVGARMQELGFSRHYLTGELVSGQTHVCRNGTYHDIELDAENQTVCLHRPMALDLGAVAKGLAVDLAVKEMEVFDFPGFVVDAGGDLYVAGTDGLGQGWNIGIRHPLHNQQYIRTLSGNNLAVCTSGTYERRSPLDAHSHHILNAHTQQSAKGFLSVTAVGPFTMLTDAFSTAAFLYPPDEALGLFEEVGLDGMVITEQLEVYTTPGMERFLSHDRV